ncbi:MAG TPA: glycosyltransferase 87 family protein [bacterium]|nr:glycosyltransferase 87 family protein [bacterium]
MNERGRISLRGQAWFLWPLALRLAAWAFLAHAYEMAVFQDVSWQMLAGQGVYARFSAWLAGAGDGYFAYPPLYAYMLWLSGWAAAALGGQWWLHQLLIKAWLVLADALVMVWLYRKNPAAARRYWVMWFVPVVAIGQVQPDLWAGLSVALALYAALRGRWWLTGALLALGAGLKVLPLIILPFLAIHLVQRRRWNALAHVGVGLAAATTAVWLPYLVLYGDIRFLNDVVRFQATRQPAGLTLVSGVNLLIEAARGAAMLFGAGTTGTQDAGVTNAGAQLWALTAGALGGAAVAAVRHRWSLRRVFCLPLLVFLLTSKVVHEHYLLQVLPLLVVLGVDTRHMGTAYGIYVLAAGSPLRFFPRELGLPSTLDALLPAAQQPIVGSIISIGLMVAAGTAAVAFSWQVLTLIRRFVSPGRDSGPLRRSPRWVSRPTTPGGSVERAAVSVAGSVGLPQERTRSSPGRGPDPRPARSRRLPAGTGAASRPAAGSGRSGDPQQVPTVSSTTPAARGPIVPP